jgi:hypothetical protein
MVGALHAEDPDAVVLPYCLSGGTDNKGFSRLGIAGYGFAPLRLPAELDFAGMFHGVDERVPLESLRFGVADVRPLPAHLLRPASAAWPAGGAVAGQPVLATRMIRRPQPHPAAPAHEELDPRQLPVAVLGLVGQQAAGPRTGSARGGSVIVRNSYSPAPGAGRPGGGGPGGRRRRRSAHGVGHGVSMSPRTATVVP